MVGPLRMRFESVVLFVLPSAAFDFDKMHGRLLRHSQRIANEHLVRRGGARHTGIAHEKL